MSTESRNPDRGPAAAGPAELCFCELDAEHAELLPARTLMTALLVPAAQSPPCADIPWWSPKPPDCK